jgi:hypothetical protein
MTGLAVFSIVGAQRIWLYADELEALCRVLDSVVDSYGKLELVVELYRCSPQRRTLRELTKQLQLDEVETLEALAVLRGEGILAMEVRGDQVMWSFDPQNSQSATIKRLAELHEIDRNEVLALMKHVAVQRFRATDVPSSLLAFTRRKRGNDAAG